MSGTRKHSTRFIAVALTALLAAAGAASAQTYTIKAKAGKGGTIVPSGSIVVAAGADQAFTITPDTGYDISNVTASVGVATFPDDAESADGLFRAADAAMYVAKRQGKNKVSRSSRRPRGDA